MQKQLVSILAVTAVITLVLLVSFLNYGPYRPIDRDSYHIEVILKSTDYVGIPFWNVVRQGIETAADDQGVDVRISGPEAETEIDLQIAMLREALTRQPDAIVLAASDYYRLVGVVEEIAASGIPIITIDSFVDSDAVDITIGTDNYAAGFKAGLLVQDYVKYGSKAAILSYVKESSTAIDRERGVRSSLGEYTDILGTWYSGGNLELARERTREILAKHPDVDVIVALNEPSTAGSAEVVAEWGLNRESFPLLIGIDNSPPIIRYLEQGIIKAIIVQKPFNMGYLGITYAIDLIKGRTTPPHVDTGAEIITKQTMYTSENQKLLFPVNRE